MDIRIDCDRIRQKCEAQDYMLLQPRRCMIRAAYFRGLTASTHVNKKWTTRTKRTNKQTETKQAQAHKYGPNYILQ
jgi:hypothetical protein